MARLKRKVSAKRDRLTFDIPSELHTHLINFCTQHDYYKGSVVCDAVAEYLDRQGKKVNARPVPVVASPTMDARQRAAIKQISGEPLTEADKLALMGE